MGSAGIGQPFKVRQQYDNNIGTEVEALLTGGKKVVGTLKSVDDSGIVLVVMTKIRPEGAKRPKVVGVDTSLAFDELKEVRTVIKF